MSSSIVKLLAVAPEEAKKLEKQETERNSDSEGIQRTEEQMDQLIKEMGNIRIQFQDMKKEMEYVKGQLKDTKTELNETKIQLEESKTNISDLGETLKSIEELGKTNSKDILANSKMMEPLLEWVEYVNNPCWNCNGAVHCLDGKVVGITRPRNGTRIRTMDWIKYCGKDKDGQAVYVRGAQGLVNENRIDWDYVMYKPAYSKWSTYDDKDFRKFVYSCPKWA